MKLENRFTVPASVDTAWAVLLDVPRIAPCMPGAALTSSEGDKHTGTVKVKLGPINLTYGGTATIVSRDEAAHVAVIEGAAKETRGTGTAKAMITCRLIGRGDETDVEVDTDLQITGKPAQFGRGVLADVSAKLVDQFAACLSDEIRSDAAAGAATAGAATAGGGPLQATEQQSGNAGGAAIPGGAAPSAGAPGAAASAGAAPEAGTAADPRTGPPPVAPLTALAADAAVAAKASPGRPQRTVEPVDLLDVAGAPVLKRFGPPVAAALLVLLVLRRLLRR